MPRETSGLRDHYPGPLFPTGSHRVLSRLVLPRSCSLQHSATPARLCPGHLSDASGGRGKAGRGWGQLVRQRAGGPAPLGLLRPALAIPGQTQWMPVGFRPGFTGVSVLGTAEGQGGLRVEPWVGDGIAQGGI